MLHLRANCTTSCRNAAAILLCLLPAQGCSVLWHEAPANYQTVVADPHHDTEKAISETQRAAKLWDKGKGGAAEQALQTALIADVTYGPAHNNLGKLYYAQRKYYLAAWEFEYAIRLMPDRPEPINNLGLVYEAVERLEPAIDQYSNAVALMPQNPVYLGNLARAKMKLDEDDPHIRYLLSDLLLYDSRPQWVCWAREQLSVAQLPVTINAAVEEIAPMSSTADPEDLPLPEHVAPPRE